MQWVIELGEFDLQYQSKKAVRGQVVIDFMVEMDRRDSVEEGEDHAEETPPVACLRKLGEFELFWYHLNLVPLELTRKVKP